MEKNYYQNLTPYCFKPENSSVQESNEDDDDEQEALETTVDESEIMDSGRYEASPSEYPNMSNQSDSMKKGKKIKKIKTEDGVSGEDEDVDIDSYIHLDAKSISVKIMRKLIPKLRIACYYSENEVNGKKKFKHLWDHKPANWPNDVPFKDPNNCSKDAKFLLDHKPPNWSSEVSFKDPNNSSKDVKKPGKKELMQMFNFLKGVYLNAKPQFKSEQLNDAAYGDPLQQQEYYSYSMVNPEHRTCQPEAEENPVLVVQMNPVALNGIQTDSYLEGQLAPSQHVLMPSTIQPQMPLPRETFVLPEVVLDLRDRLISKKKKVPTATLR